MQDHRGLVLSEVEIRRACGHRGSNGNVRDGNLIIGNIAQILLRIAEIMARVVVLAHTFEVARKWCLLAEHLCDTGEIRHVARSVRRPSGGDEPLVGRCRSRQVMNSQEQPSMKARNYKSGLRTNVGIWFLCSHHLRWRQPG